MGNLSSSLAGVLRGIARFLLRLAFLAIGLVVAASVFFAVLLLLAFWLLRAGWAKLTGRPVMPFVMRVDPRAGFHRFRDAGLRPQPREPANDPRLLDITDVESREVPAPPPAQPR